MSGGDAFVTPRLYGGVRLRLLLFGDCGLYHDDRE
jgi:hypothetical protein